MVVSPSIRQGITSHRGGRHRSLTESSSGKGDVACTSDHNQQRWEVEGGSSIRSASLHTVKRRSRELSATAAAFDMAQGNVGGGAMGEPQVFQEYDFAPPKSNLSGIPTVPLQCDYSDDSGANSYSMINTVNHHSHHGGLHLSHPLPTYQQFQHNLSQQLHNLSLKQNSRCDHDPLFGATLRRWMERGGGRLTVVCIVAQKIGLELKTKRRLNFLSARVFVLQ